MILLDGSEGEGGGQILRTALGLSLVTGQPFRIQNIRARRAKPGLLRQHLTAVEAATAIGSARNEGAILGSQELSFKPGKVKPGQYSFSVGTAGSATLVLQTILPALLLGTLPSNITLEGGTHNPHAPPFDFLEKAFIPVVNKLGPQLSCALHRAGFYPAGGGKFTVSILPAEIIRPLKMVERGASTGRRALAIVSNLSDQVGHRELKVVSEKLGWARENLQVVKHPSNGPGNAIVLEMTFENVSEVITGFGERGVIAETIAAGAVEEARTYLASTGAAGEHLADQLLIPLAMAGEGEFSCTTVSRHTETNMRTIELFLPVKFSIKKEETRTIISVGRS